ncbi:MAG: TonB-dependent receptor plug domain-containing protein [Bacteroidales bacterium]|nr:TonB-dependent receptor plug domain-containing protein [Bacteroidales bacterium]
MKNFLIILFLLFFSGLKLSAQNNDKMRQIYFKAEEEYNIGRVTSALTLLEDSLHGVKPPLSVSVYKLCGLCYLALQDAKNTEKYVRLLLKDNPHYVSAHDPMRFANIVEKIRQNELATVSTASSQAETLEEVPVPIILITEQMIKDCGAQSLQDVLLAYLPSTTLIETNSNMNFSFRGIFGTSQEKMLVMIDGIRLNSYSTNTGLVDYAIGLEKVKQIEVLRGSGSTLYGDVALSGVINVITKKADEIDGVKVSAGIGNYGQKKAGILFGKKYDNLSVTAYSDIYRSDGQKHYMTKEDLYFTEEPIAGNCIIGAYNGTPAFDLGVDMEWKHLNFKYINTSSKSVERLTKINYNPYEYDNYAKVFGIKPGELSSSQQFVVSYNVKLSKFSFTVSGCYFKETPKFYEVVADTLFEDSYVASGYFFPVEETDSLVLYGYRTFRSGIFKYTEQKADNYKISFSGVYTYGGLSNGGSVLLGCEYGKYEMKNYDIYNGARYGVIAEYMDYYNDYCGTEPSADVFLQIKHRWKNFIINSGIRYDFKSHYKKDFDSDTGMEFDKGDKINVLSPRFSVIYLRKHLNIKLNYSKSFVDAPYSKRQEQSYEELKPEILKSFQGTFSSDCFIKGLNLELNIYDNRYENLITTIEDFKFHVNWNLNTQGMETVLSYERKGFYFNTFASVYTVTDYVPYDDPTTPEQYKKVFYDNVRDNQLFYVPSVTAGFTVGYSPWNFLRLAVNAKYYSTQEIHQIYFDKDYELYTKDYTSPEVFLVNPSVRLSYKNYGINLSVSNAFDKEYYQGGSFEASLRQKGRWFMVGIEAKF